jgi:hypothetical protein
VINAAAALGTHSGNATAGNVTVGNVSMTMPTGVNNTGAHLFGGQNEFIAGNIAEGANGNATVGNLTVGNITVNTGAAALQSGAVNLVEVVGGVEAKSSGQVGTVTVGNVTFKTGILGHAEFLAGASALANGTSDSTGLVTVGNVTMSGLTGAKMKVDVVNSANPGTAGGITVGNVSLHGGGAIGTAGLSISEIGGSVGKISVGNIAVTDYKISALSISNIAKSGTAGGISVGNITVNLGETGTYAATIRQSAVASAAGIQVGNISLSAHKGQELTGNIVDTAGGKVGNVSVGNVSFALANTNNAQTKPAELKLHVSTTSLISGKGGSISAGNITISESGVTTAVTHKTALFDANVTLDSHYGSVSVGNVIVSGGVENNAGTVVLDNLANLTGWLHTTVTGTNTVTVGNIDYSGYIGVGATLDQSGDATLHGTTMINASGYLGVGSIATAQHGATIFDNSGTNAINLTPSGSHENFIALDEVQKAVNDSSPSTLQATQQSAVDSISGWTNNDAIGLHADGHTTTPVALSGSGIEADPTEPQSWTGFLSDAETAIHGGEAAFYAYIGGNTYLALNEGNHVAEIVEIMGLQTLSLNIHNYVV